MLILKIYFSGASHREAPNLQAVRNKTRPIRCTRVRVFLQHNARTVSIASESNCCSYAHQSVPAASYRCTTEISALLVHFGVYRPIENLNQHKWSTKCHRMGRLFSFWPCKRKQRKHRPNGPLFN